MQIFSSYEFPCGACTAARMPVRPHALSHSSIKSSNDLFRVGRLRSPAIRPNHAAAWPMAPNLRKQLPAASLRHCRSGRRLQRDRQRGGAAAGPEGEVQPGHPRGGPDNFRAGRQQRRPGAAPPAAEPGPASADPAAAPQWMPRRGVGIDQRPYTRSSPLLFRHTTYQCRQDAVTVHCGCVPAHRQAPVCTNSADKPQHHLRGSQEKVSDETRDSCHHMQVYYEDFVASAAAQQNL